jgi:hypothetical protein
MFKSKGKTCMVEEPSHVKQLSLNHVSKIGQKKLKSSFWPGPAFPLEPSGSPWTAGPWGGRGRRPPSQTPSGPVLHTVLVTWRTHDHFDQLFLVKIYLGKKIRQTVIERLRSQYPLSRIFPHIPIWTFYTQSSGRFSAQITGVFLQERGKQHRLTINQTSFSLFHPVGFPKIRKRPPVTLYI